ncbi:MAG: ATP-binding protein [Bdellovibrionota bacterium]
MNPAETDNFIDTQSVFSTVLLVEDEAAHATLIKRAVSPVVGEIEHVTSGKAAISALESSFFELVLCDLHLGDMSGIAVLRAIKDLRPGLPVIVLTSSSNLDDAVSAMREGAWDYTVKQFSPEFADGVKLVIQRTAQRKQQQIREMQLRSERRNFWAAAHAAQDGLAILGAQGAVVFANEAFHDFATQLGNGAEPGDAVNLVDLLAKHDHSVARALGNQLEQKRPDLLWSSEIQISSEQIDGKKTLSYFDLSLSSVKFEELEDLQLPETEMPDFHRYIFWVRDITRRKEQERFQRDLLSTTSHDLKGPLGAILTSAELLSDESFLRGERGQELVTRIASCARNSINIIDELLSARRIQDGVLIVKPKWYSIGEILEETILDYFPLAKAKSISFTSRPVDEKLMVYADRIGLHRVLGNLVSNAIKFTPSGGSVTLDARRKTNEVEISVTDSGPGIEPKARHMLFERYGRLEKHQEVEGTGLGLFVTKNIVDAHNGRIEVKSEVGVGTTFAVFLPDQLTE